MNYEIDIAFDKQLNRIEESENYGLIWGCCLSTGYTVEVFDKRKGIPYKFDVIGHEIEELEKWIDGLLKEV